MIEIVATLMGLIQGVLVWANKRSNWIFYCIQYAFLGIFSFIAHLYGDVTNSILYFCVGVVGWILWNKNKEERPIGKCSKFERTVYSTIIIVSTIVVYIVLKSTNDPLPLLDAITTTTSYVATYYMVTKKTDTWIVWFINDILYVTEYWLLPDQALYLMALNIVWTGMAIGSFITWNKIYKKQEVQQP